MRALVEVVKSNKLMYVGVCSVEGCTTGYTTPSYMKHKHSGKCKTHAFKGINQKRPYEWILGKLKNRTQEFNLEYEDILQLVNVPCAYCGTLVKQEPHNGKFYGIDRIDASKGYIKNNVTPCCTLCNQFKWNNPTNNFINHCKKVAMFNT